MEMENQRYFISVPAPTEKTRLLNNNNCVVRIPKHQDTEHTTNSEYSLDEIKQFAVDPRWNNIRLGLLISVFITVLGLLIIAIIIAMVEHNRGCRAMLPASQVSVIPLNPSTQTLLALALENTTMSSIAP